MTMKKLELLPRAERIRNEYFDEQPKPTVVKKRNMSIAWGILVIITLVLSCFDNSIIISGIGAGCLLGEFSKYTGNDLSVIKEKDTLWKKFPVIVFGTALIFTGIIGTVSVASGSETLTSKVLKKLLTVFIAIVLCGFIIRLIFLLAATVALRKRKKRCTSPVMAEFIGYAAINSDISLNREEPHGLDPLFRYHYEAVSYRFAVSENSPLLEDIESNFKIYIDPDQPDAYYLEEMSEDNKRIFFNYFITFGIAIIFPLALALPFILH
jgi:hypothetical protein